MGVLKSVVGAGFAAAIAWAFISSPALAAGPAPGCAAGQQPAFLFGFAYLKGQVGDPMGTPVECQHTDPGSGDTVQHTTTGIAVYRPATNLVTFTDGYRHWAATPDGIVSWLGSSADPPTAATPSPSPAPVEGAANPPSASAKPGVTPSSPQAAEPEDTFTVWHGVVREGGAYRRAAPNGTAAILEELDPGTPIRVDQWVAGPALYPDVIAWGQVDDADGGGYIYGGALAGVLPPSAPPPPSEMAADTGPWVDVNLTLNTVTAYQDGGPLKVMLVSPGRPGFETDTGLFRIYSRLRSQTMTGPGYSVPGVPWVQYFDGAEALHGRYWTLPTDLGTTSADPGDQGAIDVADSPPIAGDGPNVGVAFGVPSSHGCLGVQVDDAAWLYQFAGAGVPVDVHY